MFSVVNCNSCPSCFIAHANNSKLYIIDKQSLAESEKTPMMIRLISYKQPKQPTQAATTNNGGAVKNPAEEQAKKAGQAYPGIGFLHRTPSKERSCQATKPGMHSKIPHLFKFGANDASSNHSTQHVLGLESELQTLLHRQRQLDLELRLLSYKANEASCSMKLQSELIVVENKISYINTELRRMHDVAGRSS